MAAATIAALSMVFGCGVFIDTLPYRSALLEKSLAFMGSVEDQQEMAPQSALVCHPKDHLLPWRDSTKLLRRCETLSSLSILQHRSYQIAHQRWHTPFCSAGRTRALF